MTCYIRVSYTINVDDKINVDGSVSNQSFAIAGLVCDEKGAWISGVRGENRI